MMRLSQLGWVLVASLAVAVGCGSGDDVFGNAAGGSTSSSSGTGADGGGGSAGGGSAGGGSGGGTTTTTTTTTTATGGGGSGGEGGGGICVPESAATHLRPLDMYVMFDRSASMISKWQPTLQQIDLFVHAPVADGTQIALNFHPEAVNNNYCVLGAYTPADLALTPIPASAQQVTNLLAGQQPNGPSPLSPVLEATLQLATTQQDLEPDHVVVTVLLMDSDPNVCDTSIPNNAALASAAHAYNGVRTFVVALEGAGITLSNMNAIASAGGTGTAVNLTQNGAIDNLAAELSDIRARAVPCELLLPATPPGITFNVDEVNLLYTPSGDPTEQLVERVSGDADCSDAPGWYWDDPVNPNRLRLCPAICAAIKGDAAPTLDVLFGCPTTQG